MDKNNENIEIPVPKNTIVFQLTGIAFTPLAQSFIFDFREPRARVDFL